MIDDIIPTGKLFQDKYPMACHSEDWQPWFQINGYWLRMSVLDLWIEVKNYCGLKAEDEIWQVLSIECDEETADEVIQIMKEYWKKND